MVEIGQTYGDEVKVTVTFGSRPELISVTLYLPNTIDSRAELNKQAIEKSRAMMQSVLNGDTGTLEEEMGKSPL